MTLRTRRVIDPRVMATNDRRYRHNSGSGSNEPKHHEAKERPERGWVSRQGGDQTRSDEDRAEAERRDEGGEAKR